MKKIILLMMLTLSFYSLKAQYIGITAGYNYATLKGEMAADATISAYHGYYAGVTLEFPLSNLFSAQAECIYNRRGAKITTAQYGKGILDLDYLSVPILARFNIGKGINLHVGPQLEYRIANPNFYFDATDPVTRVKQESIDVVDGAMTLGVGYTTDTGWVFQIRWVQGVTNIFENNASLTTIGFSNNYDFKNRTLSLGVGYVFGK